MVQKVGSLYFANTLSILNGCCQNVFMKKQRLNDFHMVCYVVTTLSLHNSHTKTNIDKIEKYPSEAHLRAVSSQYSLAI